MYDSKGHAYVGVAVYEIMPPAHITDKEHHECKGSLMGRRVQQPYSCLLSNTLGKHI